MLHSLLLILSVSKIYNYYEDTWFLQKLWTTCNHCGIGCSDYLLYILTASGHITRLYESVTLLILRKRGLYED